MTIRASIIVSSYNQPNAMALVVETLLRQSQPDLEVVFADDGSTADTMELVKRFADRAPFPVTFTTQEDRGFRKSKALNNAIRRASGDIMLFIDGDCLAPRHWARRHVEALGPGAGLSVGGAIRLSLEQSRSLSIEQVAKFRFESLITPSQRLAFLRTHLAQRLHVALDRLNRPKIRGGNFAATRRALLDVDGFDETFEDFGKEDSDLRNRLRTSGCRAVSLWHRSWVFHCDHALDPSRSAHGVSLRHSDRAFYQRRKGMVRAERGLSAGAGD